MSALALNAGGLEERWAMTYHLEHNGVRVAVGHETRERAASRHPEPSAVVKDDEIGATSLDELGGEPDACASS